MKRWSVTDTTMTEGQTGVESEIVLYIFGILANDFSQISVGIETISKKVLDLFFLLQIFSFGKGFW